MVDVRCQKRAPVPHPERESRDPEEVTLKLLQRDPSVRAGLAFALGMTKQRERLAQLGAYDYYRRA